MSPAIPDTAPPLPELCALGSATPAGVTPLSAAIPDAVSVVGVEPKAAAPAGVRGTGPTLARVTPLGVFGTEPPPAGITPLGALATTPSISNPAARSRRLADGGVAMA